MRYRILLGLVATFGFAGVVAALDPPVAPPPNPVLPDPTKGSDKLNKALAPDTKTAPPIAQGLPLKIPPMSLKARVLANGKPGAAVIEVDGHQYTVSPGNTIIAGGVQMRVVEVTRTEVRIEVVQLKEIVVLN